MRVVHGQSSRSGFTLVELLVVLAIVLLASLVAIPTLVTNLNGRQVTDAARIFTGSLVGIRDSAIRYNQPRGIRLLPDPTLTIPAPGQPNAGALQLCYNRMIPIEPAGDYSQGRVSIGPRYQAGKTPAAFPPRYAYPDMAAPSQAAVSYPYYDSDIDSPVTQVLMLEESPFAGGYVTTGQPNSPTNWYWNIRLGDKIKINDSGDVYTVVGPCTINPWASAASGNQGNPEMFVNVGAPGTLSPLVRTYFDATYVPLTNPDPLPRPEFLFVVNSEDDDRDGFIDEGFDGLNNNPILPLPRPTGRTGDPLATDNNLRDEPFEWETEQWKGALSGVALRDVPATASDLSPSVDWVAQTYINGQSSIADLSYTIKRRPVPSPGAREVMLPAGMVIDATTWNSTRERSRIPVEPGSLYCDVLANPNGQYIPTTLYSTPQSADPLPFLHFWITDRNDVYPRGSVWGLTAGVPNHNSSDPDKSASAPYVYYELPLTNDALGSADGNLVAPSTPGAFYPGTSTVLPVIKNDRRLVTMFAQSGLITTNTIESIPPTPGVMLPGEGFYVGNVSYPFLKAQQGLREAR